MCNCNPLSGTINIEDAYDTDSFDRAFDKQSGFRTRSVLCMPVFDPAGHALGVMQVINKRGYTQESRDGREGGRRRGGKGGDDDDNDDNDDNDDEDHGDGGGGEGGEGGEDSRRIYGHFTAEDEEILSAMNAQLAVAIMNGNAVDALRNR